MDSVQIFLGQQFAKYDRRADQMSESIKQAIKTHLWRERKSLDLRSIKRLIIVWS